MLLDVFVTPKLEEAQIVSTPSFFKLVSALQESLERLQRPASPAMKAGDEVMAPYLGDAAGGLQGLSISLFREQIFA